MTDKSKEIKVKPGEKKTLATFLNVEKNVGGALFSDGRLNKLGIYVEGKSAFKQTYAQWYFFDKDVEQHEEYMQEDAKVSNGGMLSHQDIVDAYENKRLRIYPFESEVNGISALQPASYDFAFSSLVMSVQEKKKYELHVRRCLKNLDEEEIYFTLKKGDTAYVLTRECIWVSGQYAGILQSRMGAIAQGLSNISTTLDPGWLGPLLIIVTNNNNQDIDVPIAKRNKKNGEVHYQTFITLSLFQLKTPAAKVSDNNAARLNYLLEILDPTVEENKALRDGLDDLQDSFMNQLKNMFQYGDLLEGPKKNGIYNTCKFVELFDDSQKEVLLQVEQIAPLPFEEECNVIVRTK